MLYILIWTWHNDIIIYGSLERVKFTERWDSNKYGHAIVLGRQQA